MINFAGFSSGFREQSELRRRQRKELAEAFESFKKNNPYATYEEYQDFIDQNAGDGLGSNYLRGGAPSEDVLRSLADENLKRKQTEEARQRLSDLQQRQQTMDMLQGGIDAFLLSMPDNDFDAAQQRYMESFGDNAEQLFNGMNVGNYFTQRYRDQLIGDRLIDLTPKIAQYVQNTGGKVTDTAAFARYLGIPEAQIEPFVKHAASEHDRSVARWKMQNNDAVLSLVQREIDAGRDPNKAVETYLSGTGIEIDDLDMNYYTSEANRKRSLENEKRERAEEEARVAAVYKIEKTFRDDDAISEAMRRGDEEAVTNLMLDRATRYLTDEQFKAIYGVEKSAATPSLFVEVFKSEAAEAVGGQIDAQGARRDKATQAAIAAQQAVAKNNETQTQKYFEDIFGTTKAAIAAELALTHEISGALRVALTNALSTVPEEIEEAKNAAALREYVRSHPDVVAAMQSARPIKDVEKQAFDVTLNKLGGFNVESYDQFHVRTSDEITTGFREIEEDLSRADGIEDLNKRLVYLQQVERSLNSSVQGANMQIGLRRDRADRWVEYGTGGWDEARANSLLQGIGTQSTSIRDTISQKIAETQAQIQANQNQQIQSANPALPTTGTGLTNDIGNVYGDFEAGQMIDIAADNKFSMGLDTVGDYIFQSPAEAKRRADMRALASDDAYRPRMIEYLRSANEAQRQELLDDLQTMTLAEFKSKYDSRLKPARNQ